jgi:hypothetical protein
MRLEVEIEMMIVRRMMRIRRRTRSRLSQFCGLAYRKAVRSSLIIWLRVIFHLDFAILFIYHFF